MVIIILALLLHDPVDSFICYATSLVPVIKTLAHSVVLKRNAARDEGNHSKFIFVMMIDSN